MKGFNYNSEYYEQGIGGFHQTSFSTISSLFLAHAHPNAKSSEVLDFGCGNGFYGRFLRQHASQVDCVDYSAVLASSPNRSSYRSFTQADLGKPWAPGRSYDIVFSIEAVEHVEDYRQFLRNALGALKPGGRLYITTTTFTWSLFVLLVIYRRLITLQALFDYACGLFGSERHRTRFVVRFWEYFTGHYHGFSKRQLCSGLREVGFEVEMATNMHVQDIFPVKYLNQPYNGRGKLLVDLAIPLIKWFGRSVNSICRLLNLAAPNIAVVARKPL